MMNLANALRPMDQLGLEPLESRTNWVWDGYLARGNVTLLTSQWKAGKTTLLAGLLRALGSGGQFLGRGCEPGAAVVVSEEAPAHWAARGRAVPLGPHARLLSRPFRERPGPGEWADLVAGAEELRATGGLDLFVVDTLAAFLPGRSDSDPATLLDFLHPLRRLAELGAAVLVLHHPRRRPAAEGESARGSGALLGFVDVVLELHRYGSLEADRTRRKLVGLSRHPETPPTVVYDWTPGTPEFRVVDDVRTTRYRENWAVVERLLKARTQAATHKDLLADWPADRARPEPHQLYEWLGRAFAERKVERYGDGTRRSPFTFRLPGPPGDRLDALRASLFGR